MEAKHTPGPWFWALDEHNQPTSLMQSGTGDYVVCPQSEQSNYGLSSHRWNDVSEADCALIAAAPDLLEALKEAREMVMSWAAYAGDYFREKHSLADDVARIDAAISKAETGQ